MSWYEHEPWNCLLCGEGYPSAANAGVPEKGVVILVYEDDLGALRPHLPESAVVRVVRDGTGEAKEQG